MKFVKKIKNKIKGYSDIFNRFNQRYQIARTSSSLSFYMIISLISILTISIQILAVSSEFINSFLIPRIISIFSEDFSEDIIKILPSFSLSSFSILVLVNLIWSASRTIHSINRVADYIYHDIKPRTGFRYRISAFMMFAMLLLVIVFEIMLVIFSHYLVTEVFEIKYNTAIRLIQLIIEISVLFFTLLIVYLYAPPKKMHFRDAYKGALFSTILIYIILSLFLYAVGLLESLGIGYTVITVISYSLIVLFLCNYILVLGLILNYFGNIFQLKRSLFSKQ